MTNSQPSRFKFRALLGTLTLACVWGLFGGIQKLSAAPAVGPTPYGGITPISSVAYYRGGEELANAVKDKGYGKVLQSIMDTPWTLSMSWRGTTVNSNNVLTVTAYRADNLSWYAKTPAVFGNSAGDMAGALWIYFSDSAGTATGANVPCLTPTATAMTTIASGTNGGFVSTVTGIEGLLLLNSAGTASLNVKKTATFKTYIPCVVMPTGRVAVGPLSATY